MPISLPFPSHSNPPSPCNVFFSPCLSPLLSFLSLFLSQPLPFPSLAANQFTPFSLFLPTHFHRIFSLPAIWPHVRTIIHTPAKDLLVLHPAPLPCHFCLSFFALYSRFQRCDDIASYVTLFTPSLERTLPSNTHSHTPNRRGCIQLIINAKRAMGLQCAEGYIIVQRSGAVMPLDQDARCSTIYIPTMRYTDVYGYADTLSLTWVPSLVCWKRPIQTLCHSQHHFQTDTRPERLSLALSALKKKKKRNLSEIINWNINMNICFLSILYYYYYYYFFNFELVFYILYFSV